MKVDREEARTYTSTSLDGRQSMLACRLGVSSCSTAEDPQHIFDPASIRSKWVDLH
jgi:hypothetical protein